ncbi:related to YAF9-Component of a chromatin modifying complex [Sporisorium reilianum f. sp. reilianum]|uniref:Protein AF-9 homolog n=1 Tax=Sporisorium reilianum f. sp. reilianum TaxID=72559 RepID=A0A2N8U832_9BASI|nr:related to YAF9-Component of a chromatin modifying complex [Sporisorium reilianum f. sp. reilianum]
MSNKRVRGLAIHRPILYGSTSTPLTPAEKLAAPPDHTHKWTVAVRSAASLPLPSLSAISGAPNGSSFEAGSEIGAVNAAGGTATPSSTTGAAGSSATISTRGRDQEHDYHKMVGNRDDISHYIKRVQFKLHDTYAQPTRNVDKFPFHVTETGWGEFEIQIKIFFVPEANEKPLTLFHHLKLHPWLQSVAAVEAEPSAPAIPPPLPPADTAAPSDAPGAPEGNSEQAGEAVNGTKEEEGTDSMDVDDSSTTAAQAEAATSADSNADPTTTATAPSTAAGPAEPAKPALPPVVHSWQYDEIVFPEPMEPFYDILSTHPPTPLPVVSALAFADPAAYRSYLYAKVDAAKGDRTATPPIPPHPLHTPTGYLFDALSLEAQNAEADRLDMARIAAIRELDKGREQLIRAERALKDARSRIAALNSAALASGSASAAAAGTPSAS